MALCTAFALGGCGNGKVRSEYEAAAKVLPSEIAAAKAEGIPLDPSDLKRTVPDSENAALLYNEATQHNYRMHPGGPPVQPTPDEVNKARVEVAKNAATLKDLETAALRPHLYYSRDYSIGGMLSFPELSQLKQFANLLGTRARLRALDGDYRGATEDAMRIKRIAEQLSEEPTLIASLVAVAIDSIAYRTISEIVTETKANSSLVRQLQSALASKQASVEELLTAMRGESVMAVASLRYIDKSDFKRMAGGDPQSVDLIPRDVDIQLVRSAYNARLLEAQRQIFSIVKGQKVDQAMGRALDLVAESWNGKDASYNFNKVFFPVYGTMADAILKDRGRLASLQAMLEILLTPQDSASISGVLAKRTDPYTKLPLKYRKTERGFMVYSLGPNGADDGGRIASSEGRDDIGFAYPVVRTTPPPKKVVPPFSYGKKATVNAGKAKASK